MSLDFLFAAVAPALGPSVAPRASLAPLRQLMPQTAPAPQSWWQMHVPWLTHGVAGIFILCAVSLVVLLAVQTTKQEGLSGSIGGRVESAYRGRLGADEQLKRITGWVAVGFAATGFILTITGI